MSQHKQPIMIKKADSPLDLFAFDANALATMDAEQLLRERQILIDQALENIQANFYKIGKALAEIKEFRLYKADRQYPKWSEFVQYRIVPRLHQSTINDYINIVKMQMAQSHIFSEPGILQLGYKKIRFIKSKYNIVMKIKSEKERNHQIEQLFRFYTMSFAEYKDVPYSTYTQLFTSLESQHTLQQKVTLSFDGFVLEYLPKEEVLRVSHSTPKMLTDLFKRFKD